MDFAGYRLVLLFFPELVLGWAMESEKALLSSVFLSAWGLGLVCEWALELQ